MSEEVHSEKNITDELNKLGKQVADAIKAAWESDDRKKLQSEVTEGLQKFGDQMADAARRATESDSARQIKVQAGEVVTRVKESDVTEEVRKGLLTGLEAINQELGKLLEKLEAKKAAEPGSTEPPKEG